MITDYQIGAGNDTIDIADLLSSDSTYDGGAGGALDDFVRVVDSGGDAVLQVDNDGTAGGSGWQTLVTLGGLAGIGMSDVNLQVMH
jgi:hypothetical protein